jgi:glycosyltransferase involved in cell wall biosynthesis
MTESSAKTGLHSVAGADRPLRILLAVDSYFPGTGGAERQAQLLSRAFLESGHQVNVIAPRLEKEMPLRGAMDGVSVERIAYPPIRLVGALILGMRFAWKLVRERGQYDAIHVHIAKNLATVAGLVRPFLPPTLTIKISGAWEFDGGILDPARRGHVIIRLMNLCIRRADTMQCISRFTYEKLVAAGYPPERILMIPNAVDLSRFSPVPDQSPDVNQEPSVAYAGGLRAVKGIQVLVDAWAQMEPHQRLVVAGEGACETSSPAGSPSLAWATG